MLSIESDLITCRTRIIVRREMRPEMLQYIHDGHQGKECCLLRAKNTVFWPKITYDIQQLIEVYDLAGVWKVSASHRNYQRATPISIAHTGNRFVLLERMDFLIVADVFSKYILVRKLPNTTSAAVCIELSMIATELGLPCIIKSDNSPCYNSKEFQQFLQCYSITHQTSSLNHPRSNGFVERMVGVAKKLMDKAGKGKPWISGLFDYRVTSQSGSIASPLQLITQRTPRERNLPELPSALGVPEMHQTHQELIKRQGNKPEREYQKLLPRTPVWVQHRQNATCQPAIVVNQCAPNSYWIMQENGAEPSKVYRCTRTMLKIRSTPTDGEQKAQMREWSPETDNVELHIPAIPNGNRNLKVENSQEHPSSNSVQPPLPTLVLPQSEKFSENREENSQLAGPLCTSGTTREMHQMHQMHQCNVSQQDRSLGNQPRSKVTNFTCKDTKATWTSGFPVRSNLTIHLSDTPFTIW